MFRKRTRLRRYDVVLSSRKKKLLEKYGWYINASNEYVHPQGIDVLYINEINLYNMNELEFCLRHGSESMAKKLVKKIKNTKFCIDESFSSNDLFNFLENIEKKDYIIFDLTEEEEEILKKKRIRYFFRNTSTRDVEVKCNRQKFEKILDFIFRSSSYPEQWRGRAEWIEIESGVI